MKEEEVEEEEEEEEEEEYVPIDAMYRDELDVSAADGTNVRAPSLPPSLAASNCSSFNPYLPPSFPPSLFPSLLPQMRGYLVSSKMAQKFWRREERPVVLLLTDERGW